MNLQSISKTAHPPLKFDWGSFSESDQNYTSNISRRRVKAPLKKKHQNKKSAVSATTVCWVKYINLNCFLTSIQTIGSEINWIKRFTHRAGLILYLVSHQFPCFTKVHHSAARGVRVVIILFSYWSDSGQSLLSLVKIIRTIDPLSSWCISDNTNEQCYTNFIVLNNHFSSQ